LINKSEKISVMKDFIKKNIIALLALLVVIIVIATAAIKNAGQIGYKTDIKTALNMLSNDKGEVSPATLQQMLQDKSKTIVPVDLRSEIDFSRGHIEGAVNIPVYDLLGKRSMRFFKKLANENGISVLYSTTQSEANGSYLLLKQVGCDNISILQGGFDLYSKMPLPDSVLNAKIPVWAMENCRIDITALKTPDAGKDNPNTAAPSDKPKQKVIPAKKAGSTGGGC
jgi:rhodanese-related sulfurtransferase